MEAFRDQRTDDGRLDYGRSDNGRSDDWQSDDGKSRVAMVIAKTFATFIALLLFGFFLTSPLYAIIHSKHLVVTLSSCAYLIVLVKVFYRATKNFWFND